MTAEHQPDNARVVDRHGDVWTLGDDGLMHTPETAPFPFEHVEKKWGPLRPVRHRVVKTSEALYSPPRTLRKRRRCGGHLSEPHWIEVGDEAVWSSLPPNSDVGNEGWWHAVFCLDCAPAETVYRPAATGADQ